MLGCVTLYPSPPESCTFLFCPVDRFPPVPILYKLYSIIQMLVDHSIRLCATSMNSKIAWNIIFGLAVARCTSFFLLLYRNREVQNALIVLRNRFHVHITCCAHPYWKLWCTTVSVTLPACTAWWKCVLCKSLCQCLLYSLPVCYHPSPGGILHEGDGKNVPLSLTGPDHPVPGHTLPHRAQQGDDQRWSLMDHHQHWWVARRRVDQDTCMLIHSPQVVHMHSFLTSNCNCYWGCDRWNFPRQWGCDSYIIFHTQYLTSCHRSCRVHIL